MKKNGIPESNIITMAYDDVANDPENPFPGKIFNKPNGQDVYAGCNIDYKGDSVTPSNFLSILKGDTAGVKGGNGKVLKSTADSKVFVYFADHGAPGLIAFPNEYLYANDLNTAFNYMHDNKKYNELVFYLEACESGSMFDGILKDNLNIYAITAANPDESSWGTYCYPDDQVNGVHINSCLGDLFSVNWMEDSEAENVHQETLSTQFDKILKTTDKSHVMKYGQQTFTNEPIGNFQGNFNDASAQPKAESFFDRLVLKARKQAAIIPSDSDKHMSAIHSRDARLHHLYSTLQTKGGHKVSIDLSTELNMRMRTDHVFEDLVPSTVRPNGDQIIRPRNFDCLKQAITQYEKSCGKMSDYDLKYVRQLVNLCETLPTFADLPALLTRIQDSCEH
jgi:legumain